MGLVLDIAAGILLAQGIRSFAKYCSETAAEDARGGERNLLLEVLGPITILIGVVLVISRLIRWP